MIGIYRRKMQKEYHEACKRIEIIYNGWRGKREKVKIFDAREGND